LSLVVKLEDDLGERSDWIMLHGVIPSHEERDFPCLRGIDPYGETVFNHQQMETFLRNGSECANEPAMTLRRKLMRRSSKWRKLARQIAICI